MIILVGVLQLVTAYCTNTRLTRYSGGSFRTNTLGIVYDEKPYRGYRRHNIRNTEEAV